MASHEDIARQLMMSSTMPQGNPGTANPMMGGNMPQQPGMMPQDQMNDTSEDAIAQKRRMMGFGQVPGQMPGSMPKMLG
jgi:hypothetical protein